jgi:anti-sigma factor RsiW
MSCEQWQAKLDAYVDGETPGQELTTMEQHLGTCHNCAADALSRMQLKRATRAGAMRFTPSPEFRQRIQRSIAPKRSRLAFLWNPAMAFAAAVVLVVAVSAVVMVRHSEREQTVAELVDMHVAALASTNPVDVVSTDRHTVKPWFQGKLPFTFNLPELAGSQYKLVGGKLVYFRHSPGAQLIFELRKHEMSVFLVQDAGLARAGLSSEAENGFSVESWSAGGLHYVVVSDAGAGDVHALGVLLRGAERP